MNKASPTSPEVTIEWAGQRHQLALTFARVKRMRAGGIHIPSTYAPIHAAATTNPAGAAQYLEEVVELVTAVLHAHDIDVDVEDVWNAARENDEATTTLWSIFFWVCAQYFATSNALKKSAAAQAAPAKKAPAKKAAPKKRKT